MSELRELYQEVILDHSKHPRNFGKLESCNHHGEGFNPLCGDHITIYLTIKDDTISEVRFEGTGCAISTASASMMSENLRGKTRQEVEELFQRFHNLVTGASQETLECAGLGKLAVFSGVREFPVRVKCATLAWHTLISALHNDAKSVSTE